MPSLSVIDMLVEDVKKIYLTMGCILSSSVIEVIMGDMKKTYFNSEAYVILIRYLGAYGGM